MSDPPTDPPRPADHPPGYDDDDPYADVDLDDLPDWWRENVEAFRKAGMRPYRPPRFADGELVPAVVSRLESEHGVDVHLRGVDPRVGDDWAVVVDGRPVGSVGRERTGSGATEYAVTSGEFEALVREAVDEG